MSNNAENQALAMGQDTLLRSYFEAYYNPLKVPLDKCLSYRDHLAKTGKGFPVTNLIAVPPVFRQKVERTWSSAWQYFLDVRFTVLGESKAPGDEEMRGCETYGLNIIPAIRFGKPLVDVICQIMRQTNEFFYDYQSQEAKLKKLWETYYLEVSCDNYTQKSYFFAAFG